MWYVVFTFVALIVAFLLVRLRVRLEFSGERRALFVGLGRSGPEIDFAAKVGRVRLFGLNIESFSLRKSAATSVQPIRLGSAKPSGAKKRDSRRRLMFDFEWLDVLPATLTAVWRFLVGIFKAAIIEECEAKVQGGFPTPDLTGQAYGYYCAFVGAFPAVTERVTYTPDWSGASFNGSVRLSVALPVYALVYRTIVLLIQLPVRKIYRITRGKT
ncbi:MAG: hypothetical protein AB1644_04145 [Candidatus Zixiibacteriota bacterium]